MSFINQARALGLSLADFLRHLIAAVPYRVQTVLTKNGIQLTTAGPRETAVPEIKRAIAAGELVRAHSFELAAPRTTSITDSPSPNTLGPTARSSR